MDVPELGVTVGVGAAFQDLAVGLQAVADRSVVDLERDVRIWINQWNKDPQPFIWTKTADQILDTFTAYCLRISDSRH